MLDLHDTESVLEHLTGGKATPKVVEIFAHARMDLPASQEAGRRIYREEPYILIKYGTGDDGVSRPLTEDDKKRYPEAYAEYLRQRQSGSQTRVSILPACDVSLRQELRDMGIYTIEELLAAEGLGEHMSKLVSQAKKWKELNDGDEEN